MASVVLLAVVGVFLASLAWGTRGVSSRGQPGRTDASTTTCLFSGTFDMQDRKSQFHKVVYDVERDRATWKVTVRLRVSAGGGEGHVFTYSPEVGQEQVLNIFKRFLGHDLGHVVCVELTWGAGSLKLLCLALGDEGRPYVAFDDVSRFGFQVIDVTGDAAPEIVGCYGDLKAAEYTAKVFEWKKGRFALRKTLKVKEPHRYSMAGVL